MLQNGLPQLLERTIVEQWRDIPGFEGRYQVSDQGRVRSVDRYVRLVAHGVETRRLARGKVLAPAPGTHGYPSVVLGRDGGTRAVHRLVALAFLGPPPINSSGCQPWAWCGWRLAGITMSSPWGRRP